MGAQPEFREFTKIYRLTRPCIVTEKIDGTNGQIHITEDGDIFAGSRTRWLTPGQSDNFGFGAWVQGNKADLLALGPGSHFGEWWGAGIQRRYGQTAKRFSLFNVGRWAQPGSELRDGQTHAPECCDVVPVLDRCEFDTTVIASVLIHLARFGSVAAPGFMDPEGIVIFHEPSRHLFKKTIKGDAEYKGKVAQP